MNLSDYAIKNSRVTFCFLILIIFVGINSYIKIPRLEDPEFVWRMAFVLTRFPGASPERVENLVTDKIEKKIQEMPEIDYITSTSSTGTSLVYINILDKYTSMRPIWDDLKDKVEEAERELPEGVDKPVVQDDFGDVYGLVLSITGDGFSYKELKDVADKFRNKLLGLNDVAKVDILGSQDERIFVEFSNARLAEYGLNIYSLQNILREQNIILPGGNVITQTEKIVVEPSGQFLSIDALKQTVIALPGEKQCAYLGDIATIYRDYEDPPQKIMHFNGKRALGLAVSMSKTGNVVELGKRVKHFIGEYMNDLPIGIDVQLVNDQAALVEAAVDDFMVNLYEACILVFIPVLLFLGIRTGFIVGSLIPMTVLMTFPLMDFFGITLQRVSIAALIMALGMLVDNSIVMSENILVRMKEGMGRLEACLLSGKELAVPLLISTLTTCAAFLPIPLAESVVGEYCISLFQVISLTLLCSWILTMTMIALFCYLFIKVDHEPGKQTAEEKALYTGFFYRWYRSFLESLLHNRWITLIIIWSLFGVSLWGFGFVKKQFFPPSDRAQFLVDFWMPEGTQIRETESQIKRFEAWLNQQEGITNYAVYVGDGGPRFYLSLFLEQSAEHYASVVINTKDLETTLRLIPEAQRYLLDNFPNVRPLVKQLEAGAPVGLPVQIRVSGDSVARLYDCVGQVKTLLKDIPGVHSIRDDWGVKVKKLVFDIDQAKARQVGISSRDIASSLQMQISGTEITQYREQDDIIPVTMRYKESERNDLARLENMNIYAPNAHKSIPLLSLGIPRLIWEVSQIQRRDTTRTITVSCALQGRTSTEIIEEIKPRLDQLMQQWPAGYTYDLGGEEQESQEANNAILAKFPLALFAVAMIIMWQFNSFRKTFIILITIPLAMIGITFALLITSSKFGFMAMLGVISLAGVVVNNAIILLDRIQSELDAGVKPHDAIISSSLRRFRPIWLTVITTVIGLVPLSLSGEFWAPMAYVMMFGLLFATVLTLGIVPVLYSLLYKVNYKK